MSSRVLNSVQDVIASLGGPSELARWAGYEAPSGVSNWLTRGIPNAYHLRLSLKAAREGFVIDPDVYGLESEDAEQFRAVFAGRLADGFNNNAEA